MATRTQSKAVRRWDEDVAYLEVLSEHDAVEHGDLLQGCKHSLRIAVEGDVA